MYYGLINSMNKTVAPSYTARTSAFATATGITDATILGALNTFDLGLISNSLDTKMKALYPMVGGTSTTCKYNFMDARDLDVAFRLQFFGGGTFSSNGYQPNGTNAFAVTYFNSLTNFTNTTPYGSSVGIGYYSRTNSNGTEVELGAQLNILIEIRTSGTTYARAGQGGVISFSDADSLGFYNVNRLNQIEEKAYKNGVLKSTSTSTTASYSGAIINIGAWSGPQYYSTKQCAFANIGDGLTDAESLTFYNLVQAMQTTLSRNV